MISLNALTCGKALSVYPVDRWDEAECLSNHPKVIHTSGDLRCQARRLRVCRDGPRLKVDSEVFFLLVCESSWGGEVEIYVLNLLLYKGLLQCSCLENPMDGVAWWAAVHGVAQSRTRLKWLSSSKGLLLLSAPRLAPHSCLFKIICHFLYDCTPRNSVT